MPQVFVNGSGSSVIKDLPPWIRKAVGRLPSRIHFVTGFVTYRGLLLITDLLGELSSEGHEIRLLAGVNSEDDIRIRRYADLPESIGQEQMNVAPWWAAADKMLSADLNTIALSGTKIRELLLLHRLLQTRGIESRRYERGFLHAKAVVVDRDDRVRAAIGSSNLTVGGLSRNQEYNAAVGPGVATDALRKTLWWWDRSEPYDLAAPLREIFVSHRPELVYLRMLKEAFGHEVNAPQSPVMDLKDYQRDGVARVRSILSRFGGALIADEVGLGKTYVAGECARLAMLEGRPVVVVAPASLRKMWKSQLAQWKMRGITVISYDRLSQVYKAVVEDGDQWDHCGLLVLDEAHNLRNPSTLRMEAVRSLLSVNPAAHVILLSATPVNNDSADLFELLALADRSLEPAWIPWPTFHRDRTFGRSPDGDRLARFLVSPQETAYTDKEWYFEFAHSRTLRRERSLIQRAYSDAGAAMPFPLVEQVAVKVPVTMNTRLLYAAVLSAFGDLEEELADVVGWKAGHRRPLTLAAYRVADYRLDSTVGVGHLLEYLIKITLCKRLESSYAALAATAWNMSAAAKQVLTDLDAGYVRVSASQPITSWRHMRSGTFDGDQDPAFILPGKASLESAANFDVDRLRGELIHDIEVLDELADIARSAIPDDPKKEVLAELLLKALADPRGPKIVVFASARETTHDLGLWLQSLIEADDRFAAFKGRVANLGMRPEPDAAQIENALSGFAPETAPIGGTELTLSRPRDLYDVLICTDKFSEGVNLQQAAFCVNYDLVWNPQRLGQRVGRIDRVGSKHKRATCWTLLPEAEVEFVAHIMSTLHRKADVAAQTIGVPAPLFPGCVSRGYTDLLGEWNLSDIFAENNGPLDPATGSPDRDYGWIAAWLGTADREPRAAKAIESLPHGAGAVLIQAKGDQSVIFCFRVYSPDRAHHVAAFAQVYGDATRRAGHVTLDTHRCLRQARVDPAGWIEEVARERPTGNNHRYLRLDQIESAANLLDLARAAVSRAHDVPDAESVDRVQLICWMLRP